MKQATVNLRKQYVKAYLQLLTQAAEKVDGYFFDQDSEESDEARLYFYGSLGFGLAVTLLILITVV